MSNRVRYPQPVYDEITKMCKKFIIKHTPTEVAEMLYDDVVSRFSRVQPEITKEKLRQILIGMKVKFKDTVKEVSKKTKRVYTREPQKSAGCEICFGVEKTGVKITGVISSKEFNKILKDLKNNGKAVIEIR